MDNIPTGILIALDGEGSRVIGNRAACDLFAVPYGSDFAEGAPIFRDPSNGFVVKRDFLPLWRSLQSERSVDATDFEVQRRDGMRRFITMAAAPVYDGWGETAGSVAILVDVTYLRAQERSLRLEARELNSLIAREQRVTEMLLKAHLPRKLPKVHGFAFSAVYRPSDGERNVGGDWYDAFRLPGGRIGLSVGEVNATGVSATVAMAKMRQAIQSAALVRADPATMLHAANKTLALHDAGASATAVAGVLDPATASLKFISAGHPLPLVRDGAGYIREFRGVAPPLGDFEGDGARTHSAALKPGDLAVFFTDGLLEAVRDGVSGGQLLRSVLIRQRPSSEEESAERLRRQLFADRTGSDDVVILTIARCGEAGTP
jgi:PAS domain S-box-containing protein